MLVDVVSEKKIKRHIMPPPGGSRVRGPCLDTTEAVRALSVQELSFSWLQTCFLKVLSDSNLTDCSDFLSPCAVLACAPTVKVSWQRNC